MEDSDNLPIEIPTRLFVNSIWYHKSGGKKKNHERPAKRWGHSAVMHENYMYIYGGHVGDNNNSDS